MPLRFRYDSFLQAGFVSDLFCFLQPQTLLSPECQCKKIMIKIIVNNRSIVAH